MNEARYDQLVAALSLGAAVLWFLSARVNFQFGYDMDAELVKSAKKAGRWNCWAATLSGLAALVAAVKYCPFLRAITG